MKIINQFASRFLAKKFLGGLLLLSLSCINLAAYAQSPVQVANEAQNFEFALIGDIPYTAADEAKFVNLINDINRNSLAFTVHDGDLKSGSTLCSDELFNFRLEQFQSFVDPFIFVFGDNEWTDCHRANNGSYDPLERLDKLRELFTQGEESLGQRTLPLIRQSNDPSATKFRENVLWTHGNIMFVGLNVPGSNNNFGRAPEADAEYVERNKAVLAWMRLAFATAKEQRLRAVMIVIQANPGFELPANSRTGFNDFLAALEQETLAFSKPVVLVHGDSHNFRIDKPLRGSRSGRRIENFTRVETFGEQDVHWLRVLVDAKNPNVFNFQQEIVEENLVNHQP